MNGYHWVVILFTTLKTASVSKKIHMQILGTARFRGSYFLDSFLMKPHTALAKTYINILHPLPSNFQPQNLKPNPYFIFTTPSKNRTKNGIPPRPHNPNNRNLARTPSSSSSTESSTSIKPPKGQF
jgi:hypothetical protein